MPVVAFSCLFLSFKFIPFCGTIYFLFEDLKLFKKAFMRQETMPSGKKLMQAVVSCGLIACDKTCLKDNP